MTPQNILQQAWQEAFEDDYCISWDTAVDPLDVSREELQNVNTCIPVPPDASMNDDSISHQEVRFLWAQFSGLYNPVKTQLK